MIIVQNTFVCKPGNASKLAKLFKEALAMSPNKTTIMTDMTGEFHRVISCHTYENLSALDAEMEAMQKDTPESRAMGEHMKSMNDLYVSGSREIFKVW